MKKQAYPKKRLLYSVAVLVLSAFALLGVLPMELKGLKLLQGSAA